MQVFIFRLFHKYIVLLVTTYENLDDNVAFLKRNEMSWSIASLELVGTNFAVLQINLQKQTTFFFISTRKSALLRESNITVLTRKHPEDPLR
jgi:hypothetical protein